MYSDSVKQWNVFVGCNFNCVYCKKSFQAQMRRQIHNCEKCGNYEPHFHEERLNQSLPKTSGDEFIWVGSSGDIAFIRYPNMLKILEKIEEFPDKTFFFQTKDPEFFDRFLFPSNVVLGITLESDIYYKNISNAPFPYNRVYNFLKKNHPRKFVTIEPILEFNFTVFLSWIRGINPERIYVGYDTKKCGLPEPSLEKTKKLIKELEKFTIVKTKYMKEDKK